MKKLGLFCTGCGDWAATRSDVHAVALVGSWARKDAGADSDVDLMLLVAKPEAYLNDGAWANELGASSILRTQSWGKRLLRTWPRSNAPPTSTA